MPTSIETTAQANPGYAAWCWVLGAGCTPHPKNGFTLIELFIVLVIVAVLAVVGLPKFGQVTERSRQTEAISTLGAMRGAQLRYYIDNNDTYTTVLGDLDIDLTGAKFFTYSLPNPANNAQLARATRNGVTQTAGSPGYQLTINRAGEISCTAGNCAGIP